MRRKLGVPSPLFCSGTPALPYVYVPNISRVATAMDSLRSRFVRVKIINISKNKNTIIGTKDIKKCMKIADK
ncbi:MAG: hypothetical protein JO170_26565 [Verrucomicrobia bacterium]|nr:hypothetical protein [Verrucomicrobiota bacterium]